MLQMTDEAASHLQADELLHQSQNTDKRQPEGRSP